MPRESKAKRIDRARQIYRTLRGTYPDAHCELDHDGPWQLLVATILSAQCTDQRVNMVTPELFDRYSTPADLAEAPQEDIEQVIRSTGFYRNKAKSIRGAARRIVDDFDGQVPSTMDDLLSLPGVARKTANVVLGNAFGQSSGIVVDTHVQRLAQRMKLTLHENNQGDRIEKDLAKLIDREDWPMFSHVLIFHGRRCCTARKPDCESCPVRELCPSAFKVKRQSGTGGQ